VRDLESKTGALVSGLAREEYVRSVDSIRDYIARGHVYQVNMSQRYETDFRGDAFALFAASPRYAAERSRVAEAFFNALTAAEAAAVAEAVVDCSERELRFLRELRALADQRAELLAVLDEQPRRLVLPQELVGGAGAAVRAQDRVRGLRDGAGRHVPGLDRAIHNQQAVGCATCSDLAEIAGLC
jgi:hypothetical protein